MAQDEHMAFLRALRHFLSQRLCIRVSTLCKMERYLSFPVGNISILVKRATKFVKHAALFTLQGKSLKSFWENDQESCTGQGTFP